MAAVLWLTLLLATLCASAACVHAASDVCPATFLFAMNHKTGTNFFMKAMSVFADMTGFQVLKDRHWPKEQRFATMIKGHVPVTVAILRSPVETIVSGYLYHRRGAEHWWTRTPIDKKKKIVRSYADTLHTTARHAVDTIFKALEDGRLATSMLVDEAKHRQGESYMAYLQRLPADLGYANKTLVVC